MRELTALEVKRIADPGRYRAGRGLYLQVTPLTSGDGVTKSWLLRYMLNGVSRQMGLGSVDLFTLKEARERAHRFQQGLADGRDPITERKQQRANQRAERLATRTFKQCAQAYIFNQRAGWTNAKHAKQWPTTLEQYAYPVIGSLPVAAIDVPQVLKVLEPIWHTRPETASRVRQRIEAVLAWAKIQKFRSGDNPAAWAGNLDKALPARAKVSKVRNHPSLAYSDVAAFMSELRERGGISARALEFLILTAARTGEVTGALWSEIDFNERAWKIPADRMKADKEHRVPLSERALAILSGLPREAAYIFPGAKAGAPLSEKAMLKVLLGMRPGLTVHGFRSTFRTWCAERGNYPREICEQALAHTVKGVEGDYQRGDLFEKRRRLMDAWQKFCASKPAPAAGNVIELGRTA